MRIVAGKHKGRRIDAPDDDAIRPTSDRARQALFNILQGGRYAREDGSSAVSDAIVLDAFAGTGALGLEALSRGAARVTFLDNDRQSLALIGRNVASLDLDDYVRLLAGDATTPPRATEAHNLVFLDPPYGAGLAAPALVALAGKGWLAPDALVIVELGRDDKLSPVQGFSQLDERGYGKARLVFLRYAA
jgi:16S rRNA (guanine966-N2)-methyltransferase